MFKLFLKTTVFSFVFFLFVFNFQILSATAAKQDYQLSTFAKATNYSTDNSSIEGLAQKLITAALSIMGILFLAFALYAGIRWMTAQGNEDKVTTAKDTLEAAVIGLVVVASSYAITNLIFSKLGAGGSGSATSTASLAADGEVCQTDDDCDSGNCGSDNTCQPALQSDLANGEACTAATECTSGVCGGDGKCATCTKDADCTGVNQVCSVSVCKAKAASKCNPVCAAGNYCDDVDSKCKPGCNVDKDCLQGQICSQAFHMCETSLNLGASCGDGLGTCAIMDSMKGASPKYLVAGAVCSQSKTTAVYCYIKDGMCATNDNCDGTCNTQTHTCVNSKQGVCEKAGNYWAYSFNKCMFTADHDKCEADKTSCKADCQNAYTTCVDKCTSDNAIIYQNCTPQLNQDLANCDKKYDANQYPASLASCKSQAQVKFDSCKTGAALQSAKCKSDVCGPIQVNINNCTMVDCQKKFLDCMNSAPSP